MLWNFIVHLDLWPEQIFSKGSFCNSALKIGVHWYLENLRKWTLSTGLRIPPSSRDLHSCRWKVQFPGGQDPHHGTDLEQKSKVRHCSHQSFPSSSATQKLWNRTKSWLCLPEKANLTEIRPQQRLLHQLHLLLALLASNNHPFTTRSAFKSLELICQIKLQWWRWFTSSASLLN